MTNSTIRQVTTVVLLPDINANLGLDAHPIIFVYCENHHLRKVCQEFHNRILIKRGGILSIRLSACVCQMRTQIG